MARILVTGGTGFVGGHLLPRLAATGAEVVLLSRAAGALPPGAAERYAVGDLGAPEVPVEAFKGGDVLIHLAGHVAGRGREATAPTGTTPTPVPVEDSHNVRMARIVAERARSAGIAKILLLSSIAASVVEHQPHLARRYGHEKLAAEQVVRAGLGPAQRLVILRPPAIYGPGMTGALATLAGLIRRGVPLPFARTHAVRDYLAIDNLVALLVAIAIAPDAAWSAACGKVFVPSDGVPIATSQLVRMMALAMDRPARLVAMPEGLLRMAGRLSGRTEMVSGALDGLELADNAPLADLFDWRPATAMPASLAFLADRKSC